MGAKVFRVGAKFTEHGGLHWPDDLFPKIDIQLRPNARWEVPFYVDLCTASLGAPDLILYSEESYHNEIVPKTDIPSILWSFDGWPENFERIGTFKATKGFINHPFGIRAKPRLEEDRRWEYLPGACAPWVHKDLNLTRDIDFVLLATMYTYRPYLCQGMLDKGYMIAAGFATTSDFIRYYNRGLLTFQNANGQEEIKWRFFEAAAMGICITADHTRLYERLGYKAWEHYIPCPVDAQRFGPDQWEIWPSVDALAMVMEWVKQHPKESRTIAKACQQRVLSQDTYYHRMVKMVESVATLSPQLMEFYDRQHS